MKIGWQMGTVKGGYEKGKNKSQVVEVGREGGGGRKEKYINLSKWQ